MAGDLLQPKKYAGPIGLILGLLMFGWLPTSVAQELVPVTSRKTVGWGIRSAGSSGELPAPINPQEEEEFPSLEVPVDESGEQHELPKYTGGPTRRSEVITQRYSDGKPQVTRNVMQDEAGNFLNHGKWKLFSPRGEVMAEGVFSNGLMNGSWKRWHPANTQGLLAEAPFNMFQGPFLSVASFSRGKLDGTWTIFDRNRRKIFEMRYQEGKREGRAVWYLPNSRPMREVDFRNGQMHGQMIEYNREGKKTLDTNFDKGQELIVRKSYYFKDQMKSESYFIGPKSKFITEDDWWNADPAQFELIGEELQHGPKREWYRNGQLRLAGQYRQGVRVGSFMWWHANGQKQIEGQFQDGDKVGAWVWHHANSQKAIQGNYEDDVEIGVWNWWDENGDLEDERDFSAESTDIENLEGIENMEAIDGTEGSDDVEGLEIMETPAEDGEADRDT